MSVTVLILLIALEILTGRMWAPVFDNYAQSHRTHVVVCYYEYDRFKCPTTPPGGDQ